ncbi:Fe-S cluster assembly protein SufD [Breoghania corrubedonensis]|uniref:Fe-S cluster assembly protein SufD n=1 Tax=Breoghania corrubedonensis TaxID=665038 RepID=A0A2T5V9X8_9HYPH|nr:Fe-S cluster assembly protein SufD [Breoghania corrubedonensis]PTW60562.1 Fe-S cluster assembly protein SufD [Breoghania corrubedonensis]
MTADNETLRTAAERALIEQYEAAPTADAVKLLREKAIAGFRSRGLPNRRVEEWKYTDLRRGMSEALPIAEAPEAGEARAAVDAVAGFGDMAGARIVFVNGLYVPELSDIAGIEGLTITSLATALGEARPQGLGDLAGTVTDSALDLNTAFMRDGALIEVAAGATIDRPVEILHVATGEPAATYTRHVVHVGTGAKVRFNEVYSGKGRYQTNTAIEFSADKGADVSWIKLQNEGHQAQHLSTFVSALEAEVGFDHFVFNSGGHLARTQVFLRFNGENARAGLRGTMLITEDQHSDVTLVVDHAVPNCVSREFYKSAIDGKAKGVFQGRINVFQHAQKTDGQMMCQALLLSDEAEMAYKPELEIFADDVQCAHGATSGQIDAELMFYLQARGIPEAEAKTLLILAFLSQVIEEIGDEQAVEALEERTRTWLGY